MKLQYLYELFLFVMLVLFQVLLLNRMNLFGVAAPILYVYFLLKLPMGRNMFYVIISGFLLGLVIDIFLNTPGMNAAATTIVAALRKPVMDVCFSREEYDNFVPGIHSAAGAFIRFAVFMVLLHLTLLFFIESFSFFNVTKTLLRIVASSSVTLVLIITLDSLMYKRKAGVQS